MVNPCPKPSSTCFGETWAWFFNRLTQIGSLSFSAHLVTDAQSRKNADGSSAPKKVFLILDNIRGFIAQWANNSGAALENLATVNKSKEPLTGEALNFGATDGVRTHDNWNHNPGLYR